MEKLSRRTALKGLGVLAGGIGASSAGIAIAGEAGAVPLSAVEGTRALTLHGSGLRTVGRSGRTSGDQVLLRGDLSFRVGGAIAGSFFSIATLLDTPGRFRPSVGSLAVQTFSLQDGKIVGTGDIDHDGSGTLVVTGGTGAFHGARGSYTASQAVNSFGGGHAVYTFTLLIPEARP
jgi:hypothetical protein